MKRSMKGATKLPVQAEVTPAKLVGIDVAVWPVQNKETAVAPRVTEPKPSTKLVVPAPFLKLKAILPTDAPRFEMHIAYLPGVIAVTSGVIDIAASAAVDVVIAAVPWLTRCEGIPYLLRV
tara:strand:- start:16 stop:378 length:363 start_codon:yes stop_codon:yes gene_type:complete